MLLVWLFRVSVTCLIGCVVFKTLQTTIGQDVLPAVQRNEIEETVEPTATVSQDWIRGVRWSDPGPRQSKQPEEGWVDASRHDKYFTNIGIEDGKDVRKATRLCFEQGVGWVWNKEPLPRLKLRYEIKRVAWPKIHTPAKQGNHKILERKNPGVLLVVADSRITTVYHLLWAYLSAVLTYAALKETHGNSTMSVYLQSYDGGESFSKTPSHYFRTLLNILGDELFFADDFGRAAGDVVCHQEGFAGGLPMYSESRGRKLFERKLNSQFAVDALIRQYGIKTPVASKKLLLVQRGTTRRLTNIAEMQTWAETEGWSVSVTILEKLPMAAQYAALSSADVVLQMHGSSMAWMAITKPYKIWVEVLPVSGGASSAVQTPPSCITLNSGHGTYGKISHGAGAHHLSWLNFNLSDIRSGPDCNPVVNGRLVKPVKWKHCSMRFPKSPFLTILGPATSTILQNPRKILPPKCFSIPGY